MSSLIRTLNPLGKISPQPWQQVRGGMDHCLSQILVQKFTKFDHPRQAVTYSFWLCVRLSIYASSFVAVVLCKWALRVIAFERGTHPKLYPITLKRLCNKSTLRTKKTNFFPCNAGALWLHKLIFDGHFLFTEISHSMTFGTTSLSTVVEWFLVYIAHNDRNNQGALQA